MTPRSRQPAAPRGSRIKLTLASADDGLPGVEQESVTLSNGTVVTLRGLTLGEVRDALDQANEDAGIDANAAIIAACTVTPKITVERMAAWLASAPAGDARKITDAALKLCAMGEGATKRRVSTHRNGSTPSE